MLVGAILYAGLNPIHDTKESFYVAAMRSDLRNLVIVEDQVRRDSGKYLTRVPTTLLVLTRGVQRPEVTLTPDGWTAEVSHEWTPRRCAVFVGSTPIAPATLQREPRCT